MFFIRFLNDSCTYLSAMTCCSQTYIMKKYINTQGKCSRLPRLSAADADEDIDTFIDKLLQYRLPRNSRCFSRLFREKPEFYGENPIAKRFGMGFSQATVHALDRACTVENTGNSLIFLTRRICYNTLAAVRYQKTERCTSRTGHQSTDQEEAGRALCLYRCLSSFSEGCS